jgi:hypothetical protein
VRGTGGASQHLGCVRVPVAYYMARALQQHSAFSFTESCFVHLRRCLGRPNSECHCVSEFCIMACPHIGISISARNAPTVAPATGFVSRIVPTHIRCGLLREASVNPRMDKALLLGVVLATMACTGIAPAEAIPQPKENSGSISAGLAQKIGWRHYYRHYGRCPRVRGYYPPPYIFHPPPYPYSSPRCGYGLPYHYRYYPPY